MATKESDVYTSLRVVDVSDHVEEKDTGKVKLKYLSWAWAWDEVRKRYPSASYEIVTNSEGLPYFADNKLGIMCYTNVTIDGETHMMWLPVMDGANNPMKLEPYDIQMKWGAKHVEAATMFDINKTIMRCLTKNLAMFGIGIALYAGEDLFDDTEGNKGVAPEKKEKQESKAEQKTASKPSAETKTATTEGQLGLTEVIKELDEVVKTLTADMTEDAKNDLAALIKKKVGKANYRLTTNVVALNELLADLNRKIA